MEKDNITELFNQLQGSMDHAEPAEGHQERFSAKLGKDQGVVQLPTKKRSWWKPLSIAASVVVLLALGLKSFAPPITAQEEVAKISPEAGNSQIYFASLIEEQVKLLESKNSPENQKIISDTMLQLKKLETNYDQLEQDILNGGNTKLLLSAMITNFQNRIDLLQDVMNKIETIETLKQNNDANFTI